MAANYGSIVERGDVLMKERAHRYADWRVLAHSPERPRPAPDAGFVWDLIEKAQRLGEGAWGEQIAAARGLLSELVHESDGQWFVYQVVHSPYLPPAACSEASITDAQPLEAAGVYPGQDYRVAEDPVAHQALHAVRPFFWHELPGHGQNPAGPPAIRMTALGGVMTIPIHHGPEVAALSIMPHPDRVARLTEHTHLLCLLAHLVHVRVRRAIVEVALSVSPRRRSLLSPRESEVLNLVALGKSTSEIAGELAISTKGVEFHIDGAKRKLNVSNRTHAVAKAITLGLITYGHDERTPSHARDLVERR